MIAGPVAWHDVECASYTADLPLWRALAAEHPGPVLDLGCGTGRVALDLAAQGHRVVGLDADADLAAELGRRARERGLSVEVVVGDARSFELERPVRLAIAPMQVVQVLGGASGRARMLQCVRRHLEPNGVLALALADPFEAVAPGEALPPLPDVREQAGWVLSSRPVAVSEEPGAVRVDRLRQAVSPGGELTEELHVVRLDSLTPAQLEREAAAAGLTPAGRRTVPETRDHVGSTVVVLEARA